MLILTSRIPKSITLLKLWVDFCTGYLNRDHLTLILTMVNAISRISLIQGFLASPEFLCTRIFHVNLEISCQALWHGSRQPKLLGSRTSNLIHKNIATREPRTPTNHRSKQHSSVPQHEKSFTKKQQSNCTTLLAFNGMENPLHWTTKNPTSNPIKLASSYTSNHSSVPHKKSPQRTP
jgi:hypothetical protein